MSSVLVVLAALQLSSAPQPWHGGFAQLDLDERAGGSWLLERTLTLGDSSPSTEGAPREAVTSADTGSEERLNRLRAWERGLKYATAGALVATATLGTLVAINQPTAFGDGRCVTGDPIFGTYGCDRGLSTLHGASGVLSATLYTANGALALSIPGPVGNVSESERPWHRALTYVHLGGIILQPILGLVAAFPQVIGKNEAPTDTFPRTVRTIHVTLGYVTVAAYLATLALEL